MRSPALRVVLAALALVLLLVVTLTLREPVQPYVITAIDYHFHDAHPTFPIAPGRDLVVRNAGRNTHNVTIDALDLSEDVAPGQELVIADIADQLPPGRYGLACKYHQDRGMNGVLVIAGA